MAKQSIGGIRVPKVNVGAGLLVSLMAAAHRVGFQMAWSSRGENAQLLKETLREALDRGVDLKAHWIEVYAGDVRDPANSRALEQAGTELKRLHRLSP